MKIIKNQNTGLLTVSATTKESSDGDLKEEAFEISDVDYLLWAVGRSPNTLNLGIDKLVRFFTPDFKIV